MHGLSALSSFDPSGAERDPLPRRPDFRPSCPTRTRFASPASLASHRHGELPSIAYHASIVLSLGSPCARPTPPALVGIVAREFLLAAPPHSASSSTCARFSPAPASSFARGRSAPGVLRLPHLRSSVRRVCGPRWAADPFRARSSGLPHFSHGLEPTSRERCPEGAVSGSGRFAAVWKPQDSNCIAPSAL